MKSSEASDLNVLPSLRQHHVTVRATIIFDTATVTKCWSFQFWLKLQNVETVLSIIIWTQTSAVHNFVYMARLDEFRVMANFAKVLALGLCHFSSPSGPLTLLYTYLPAFLILNPY